MLVLDISCQQLAEMCQLEGFCAPFGRRVSEHVYFEIYIFVLDIGCQHLGNISCLEEHLENICQLN